MKKVFLFMMIMTAYPLYAATITYKAIDLADTTVGEDLWQYKYTVKDHVFPAGNGFSIFFDSSIYGSLQNPAPFVNPNWDILVLQPDDQLLADGIYDALALVNNPSLTDIFTLTFVWRGLGTPSFQRFEIYDTSFNIIENGNTTVSIVPVPPAFVLFGSSLLMLMGRKMKSRFYR